MKRAHESLNLGHALPLDFLPGEMLHLLLSHFPIVGCLLLAVRSNLKRLSIVTLRSTDLVNTRLKAIERNEKPQSK